MQKSLYYMNKKWSFFMANISYVRAAASCLPFVGPFVALYNLSGVRKEVPSPFQNQLSEMRYNLIGEQGKMAAARGDQGGRDKAINELETEKAKIINNHMAICQKGRMYATCGIVGSVLSVATAIGLIALGILSPPLGFVVAASFTGQTAAWIWGTSRLASSASESLAKL
jgi:hypothetical protein